MEHTKERWIDIGKCVAILAVMTNHLYGGLYGLYYSEYILRLSFFSVSLFILLMGVTTYWTFENAKTAIGKKILKRIMGILMPYIAAVFVYHWISYGGFSWIEYKNYLIYFNISGPHYYVLLYIQLLLISPIVFYIIKKIEGLSTERTLLIELIFGGVLAYFARIVNLHTNIADIYATKLFGGTYILCLYIGMLIGKYYRVIINMDKWRKIFLSILSLLMMIIMIYMLSAEGFVLDKYEWMGTTINPPGITLTVYAVAIMMSIYLWDNLISNSRLRILNIMEISTAYIGKQTLYIFLYHRLFLDYFLNKNFSQLARYIKVPLYYLTMIFGSILIGYLYKSLKNLVVQSYLYRRG